MVTYLKSVLPFVFGDIFRRPLVPNSVSEYAHSRGELYSLDATQVLELYNNNSITVVQYATALLNRVRVRNPIINAWTYYDEDLILSQARALDKIPKDERGPLHGVAVAIKDVMNTKDMPTQYGSPLYQGNRPDFDSSAVSILRSAGALIFGKSTTTEFTVTNSGPNTTNPHDRNRTPGGSSAGSAAAVADFQVPLSVGTQTGGSVIRPASYCGVFAMKPTYNSISPEGQKIYSVSFDTFGFFARSIDDLQLFANVFAIRDDDTPKAASLSETSVALLKTPMWSSAGQGTKDAMDYATDILKKSGVHVEEVDFPAEFGEANALSQMFTTIANSEAQAAFLREYRMDKTKLAPEIDDLVENKARYTQRGKMQALDDFARMRALFDDLAANYSAIITPSAPDEAPLGLGDMGSAVFNYIWTGLHMPVINIPAFTGSNGMPVGLSVVAGRGFDQHLLSITRDLSKQLVLLLK